MLMSCFAARFSFVMIVSMTLLTTQCYEEVEEGTIESVNVVLCDNSGNYPVPLTGYDCNVEALVIKVIPNWSIYYADIFKLPDPLTAIKVIAINVDGDARIMTDFKCLVTGNYGLDSKIIDFEFDDTGERLTSPLEAISYQHDFYLAYIPAGEPLTGVFCFDIVLEFKNGRRVEGTSGSVRLVNNSMSI